MGFAALFPGQGSQEVGMGLDLFEASGAARDVFAEADDALGLDLSRLIFEGPDDELTLTHNAQPAILTASIAMLRAFEEQHGQIRPAFFAGHSLGEYTALVAAGSLSLGDAVRLVRLRGDLMQNAVPEGRGAMSAVLGLDRASVEAACEDSSDRGVVVAANINSPMQIVISGKAEAVARAGELAKQRGARRVVPLHVSAPFHCSLMRPVAERLSEEFEKIAWRDPSAPLVSNAEAKFVRTASEAKASLVKQTWSPVLWCDCVEAMHGAGTGTFVEFGPGGVLTGLTKKIIKGARTASVAKLADMAHAAEAIEGGSA